MAWKGHAAGRAAVAPASLDLVYLRPNLAAIVADLRPDPAAIVANL
jgi:hypothetical protein